jgi:exodeoxyribonuclease VII large subunit
MEAITLYELNHRVRLVLNRTMNELYWIQAELSDVRPSSGGHCYLEFVQKNESGNTLLARARGNIWRDVFPKLRRRFEDETGQLFTSGIKVMVQVSVQFHEQYGYSLNVVDIDPVYTLGDMQQRRREILQRLEEEGVLTLNKELDMPMLPKRIAIISSPTAAGYGDFCDQLRNNRQGYTFTTRLFPALMQGEGIEASVIRALEDIAAEEDDWDVVVIIRGGGATGDLAGFETYLLAAYVAQFPLPVITGIGHERDDTVIDMVAHTRVKTPTAAAEFLIERVRSAEDALIEMQQRLVQSVQLRLEQEKNHLQQTVRNLPYIFMEHKRKQEQYMDRLHQRAETAIAQRLRDEQHRIDLLEQKIVGEDPERLLKRGYSITLCDGKVVRDITTVHPGDALETRIHGGSIRATVTETHKNESTQK